ncbi:MAG TPA: LacI family DNA-binding transcriptional regulator [Acidobacteriaceae bacterium]|jgi:LacI family transcriptional regulator|nr:LacI family DNA-binding transcriptional regulator [Acidobacteriaceae bacterium]
MNIREVAKKARVSTATVSRVINGSAPVSEDTAARVRQVIQQLNFYPNTHARTLGSGRSRMYGLIISDITNPFFPELVKSFEDIAVEHGQEVIVANTDYQPKRMETCVRRMLERKVDGVAIMTSEMEMGLVEMLSLRGIPMVFLDTGVVGPRCSNIEIDYSGGIDQAIEHLAALGHRRISFITGPMELKSVRTRYEAFRKSMERKGIPFSQELVRHGNHRIDGGQAAMGQLLQLAERPTAVVASNDLTAIGAMGTIHEAGLDVPKDISIIGYDDLEISNFTQPPLTTIRVSRSELATRAFTALFAASHKGESQGIAYKIKVNLIIRQTTGIARTSKKQPKG